MLKYKFWHQIITFSSSYITITHNQSTKPFFLPSFLNSLTHVYDN